MTTAAAGTSGPRTLVHALVLSLSIFGRAAAAASTGASTSTSATYSSPPVGAFLAPPGERTMAVAVAGGTRVAARALRTPSSMPARIFGASMMGAARRLESSSSAAMSAAAESSPSSSEEDESPSAVRARKLSLLRSSSRLSLAPMMEYTDRHFRHVVRLLSRKTLLYTEMVAANAIAREREDALGRLAEEEGSGGGAEENYNAGYMRRYLGQGSIHPLEELPEAGGGTVLQLGGSDPQQLHDASLAVLEQSLRPPESGGYPCEYTALNLNCGCPSPKVAGKGCFGAALMEDPTLVRECARAMHDGAGGRLPVTVKCRTGTDASLGLERFTREAYDALDPEREYSQLCRFIETVASDGIVTDFQIHARIAVLTKSFSPADNRKVPPLRYDYVRRLTEAYPELTFSLNGGVETLSGAREELERCPNLAGVMIGRGLAADPWGFACADSVLYGDKRHINDGDGEEDGRPKNRLELLEAYGHHADLEEALKDPIYVRRFIAKAVSPLFAGEPNAKRFRIALDQIGGMPKQLRKKSGVEWVPGEGLAGQTKVSELILNAALEHLSEEVLRSTPEEGWERREWEEKKRRGEVVSPRTVVKVPSSSPRGAEEADSSALSSAANGVGEVESSAVSEWRKRRDEDRAAAEDEKEDAVALGMDDGRGGIAEEDQEDAEAVTIAS